MSVTILCTHILNGVFHSISFALDFSLVVRYDVSIHDVYRIVLVSKGVKSDVEVPVVVNHVEVHISTILSAYVLAVLNQRILTRNCDANKIRFEKNASPNSHSVYRCNGRCSL